MAEWSWGKRQPSRRTQGALPAPPAPQGRTAAGPGSKCWASSRLTPCRQLRAQVGPRGFRQHDHFLLCFSKRSGAEGWRDWGF